MAKKLSIYSSFQAKDGLTPFFKKATKSSKLLNSSFNRGLRSMNRGINKFAKLGTVAFAGVSASAFAVFKSVEKIAIMGDEIGKTARQIGISGKALQEWRFIAERQGVTSADLTKSYQILNRNIGDLRLNQGMLTTTLKRSNPQLLQQLRNTKNSEQAFKIFIKEIGKLENAQDKAALAQAAFGRGGREMLKIAELSTAGLAKLRAEANALGFILTDKQIKQAEVFQDSLLDLKKVFLGLKISIGAGLVPIITKLMNRFIKFLKTNKKLIGLKVKQFFQGIGKALNFLWKYRETFKIIGIGVLAFVVAVKAVTFAIKTWTAVQWLLNIAMTANPVGLVVVGIGLLVASIVWLIHRTVGLKKVWELLTKAFNYWLGSVKNSWKMLKQFGQISFSGLLYGVDLLGEGFTVLKNLAVSAFEGIKIGINFTFKIFTTLYNLLGSAVNLVSNFFTASGEGGKAFLAVWTNMGNAVMKIIGIMKSGILSFASLALNFLIAPIEKALDLASNLPGFLGGDKALAGLESILAMKASLAGAAAEARKDALGDAITTVSGENSQSKIDITLKSADGSTAEIEKPKNSPHININNMALGAAQ